MFPVAISLSRFGVPVNFCKKNSRIEQIMLDLKGGSVFLKHCMCKGKVIPHSLGERRGPQLIPELSSQPADGKCCASCRLGVGLFVSSAVIFAER